MTEHDVQRKLVRWLRARGHLVVAICNEQVAGPHALGRLKAQGFVPGWPDIEVLVGVAPADQRTIYIEVKTKTGELSANQLRAHRMLRRRGRIVLTVYGLADARTQCMEAGL